MSEILSIDPIKQFSTKNMHTLVLTEVGRVYGWGHNGFYSSYYKENLYSYMGDGEIAHRPTPVQVHGVGGVGYLENIEKISAGYTTALALDKNGHVYAWGANDYGGYGIGTHGTLEGLLYPVQVLGVGGVGVLENIVDIAAGAWGNAAVDADGHVYSWGHNSYGQVGDGTTTNPQPYLQQVKGPGGVGFLNNIKAVYKQGYKVYALSNDGRVYGWGQGVDGLLGTGNYDVSVLYPELVLGPGGTGVLENVERMSVGGSHALALTSEGHLYAWGNNLDGQLGDGTTNDRTHPVRVLGIDGAGYLDNIRDFAAGVSRLSLAVLNDGTVCSWGSAGSVDISALGDVDAGANRPTPGLVDSIGEVGTFDTGVKVQAGSNSGVVLAQDGKLYSWGQNTYEEGWLGQGTVNEGTPIPGMVLFDYSAVSSNKNIWVRKAGAYNPVGDLQVKKNGQYNPVVGVWVKKNGIWKPVR